MVFLGTFFLSWWHHCLLDWLFYEHLEHVVLDITTLVPGTVFPLWSSFPHTIPNPTSIAGWKSDQGQVSHSMGSTLQSWLVQTSAWGLARPIRHLALVEKERLRKIKGIFPIWVAKLGRYKSEFIDGYLPSCLRMQKNKRGLGVTKGWDKREKVVLTALFEILNGASSFPVASANFSLPSTASESVLTNMFTLPMSGAHV